MLFLETINLYTLNYLIKLMPNPNLFSAFTSSLYKKDPVASLTAMAPFTFKTVPVKITPTKMNA